VDKVHTQLSSRSGRLTVFLLARAMTMGKIREYYKEQDRDFVVNMAGCEWGRDCWGEMYNIGN
jgi:hypothetical protein